MINEQEIKERIALTKKQDKRIKIVQGCFLLVMGTLIVIEFYKRMG